MCVPARSGAIASGGCVTIPGQAAEPGQIAKGCAFAPRCAYAADICRESALPYALLSDNHRALCHFPRGVAAMIDPPLLDVRGLSTDYTLKRRGKTVRIQAVKDVSFTLAKREVLGIVGESGCGKTSVGRSIVRLAKPHRGEVIFRRQRHFYHRWSTTSKSCA